MKKVLAALTVMVILGLAPSTIPAMEWKWECPVLLLDPETNQNIILEEIAADPTKESNFFYGIKEGGTVVEIDVDPPDTCLETEEASAGSDKTVVNDIVVGPTGQAFVCTKDIVGYYPSLDELLLRPRLPKDAGAIIPGDYIRISVGYGGKLFVLYQTPPAPDEPIFLLEQYEPEKQYILIGNPPAITEGVTISFKPRSLNLKSKGKWVSCHIGLPDPYDAADIDPDWVKINAILIEGFAVDPYVVSIGVDPAGPMEVEDGKLKVKFKRSEVIGAIDDLLSDDVGKFVRATLTVEGLVGGLRFEGTDTIKVKTGQKKKKK